MKRTTYLAALISGFMLFGAKTALADTISVPTAFSALQVGGVYTVTGDLLITSTGSITYDDNTTDCPAGGGNFSACPIKIVVTGNMLMQAGSLISARNLTNGGNGGETTITVGGNMTMCGPSGTQDPGCGGAKALDGAQILTGHNDGAGDTGVGGDITIKVGPDPTHGKMVMGGSSGANAGAIISAGSIAEGSSGFAGNISIAAGGQFTEEAGAQVLAEGKTTRGHGGRIFVDTSCGLDVYGKISSKGQDPGADLVHLASCQVHLYSTALVQSTGPGHDTDVPNSCDNVADGPGNTLLPGEVLRDHPANSTTCVEIWARHVIIDQGAEVNADFGLSGGSNGHGWVDIFAEQDIIINGPAIGTAGDTPGNDLKFAVHANNQIGNPFPGSSSGGDVTVKAKNAFVTLTGQALQANQLDNADPGGANGGQGGAITVQASALVTMDGATLQAAGDNSGGANPPCDSGSGACGLGGTIDVRSFNSAITWQNGVGDVNPDNGPAPPAGNITLTACTAVTTTGSNFFNEVPTVTLGACGGSPSFPLYVIFNPNGNWNTCGDNSIDGVKFNDVNGDGSKAGDALLGNWQIHITGPGGYNVTVLTDPNPGPNFGHYHVTGLAPGDYKVCEVLQATWTQTFPLSPPPGNSCGAGEGVNGYIVHVGNDGACCSGTTVTGKDFGNVQTSPPLCPEDPNRALLLTRTVDLSKPNGSGGGVAGNPKNYWLVQAAYDVAKVSGQAEVIGMFSKTNENLLLDGSKSLTITQCTSARVTAVTNTPVWNITSTGKLTIIGPDAVGGSIGWSVGGAGGHSLKSIRANGAKQNGVLISTNGNSVSWNDVSGNGSGAATDAGIRVTGGSNTLKGSTVGSNKGDGVQLVGGSNNLSGATIQSNTGNGVMVSGASNTVQSNSINQNTKNGVLVSGSTNQLSSNSSDSGKGNGMNGIQVSSGTGNQLNDNKMISNGKAGFDLAAGTGTKAKGNANSSNTGNEYTIGTGNVDQTGNKRNGTSFTFTNSGGIFN